LTSLPFYFRNFGRKIRLIVTESNFSARFAACFGLVIMAHGDVFLNNRDE